MIQLQYIYLYMIWLSIFFNFLVSCLIFAETYLPVFFAMIPDLGIYI